ncbi:unnamed protein product [Cuscuta campestris]|uniref:Mitochondrial import inner membrane translocase subunit TIM50 n=1 Tax=Cuscuta campestris TaxID=132261 RepID=A0A484NPH1_9ASTE|nr:unnamed protein product [Cuscuta campestris]
MIVSGLPTDDGIIYDVDSSTMFFPDYKCEEPDMFTNIAEEYMLLPFLEHTPEAFSGNDDKSQRSCNENSTVSDQSSLYMAIHQIRPHYQETDVFEHTESDQFDCFDPHVFIRNVPDLPDVVKPASVPNKLENEKPVTLVLDLDASQSIYAKQLLDILDPDGKYISRRAYRESCIFSDGSYTKDLTVLGVDLAKIVIIDNSPQVFRLQVNNGIPIKSWFDDPSDSALISLLPFLETLADADDVRPIIAEKFGNKE